MKYSKETTKKLTDALSEGLGRIRACRAAKISFETFNQWMKDSKKAEFSEAIKKAEEVGNDYIEEVCLRKIIEDKSWQSSAWLLERTKPNKYGQRAKFEHTGADGKELETTKVIIVNSEQAKQTQEAFDSKK